MKDWKACVRTWEHRSNKKTSINPNWLNQTIENSINDEPNKDFEDFIKEFRNE